VELPELKPPDVLLFHALPHPKDRVQQVGFPLDHPYVEQCWVGVIGPSSTLLLRRLPAMWQEAMPAEVVVSDLALSLGLRGRVDHWQATMWRTLDRLRAFGFATPVEDGSVGVYMHVPAVPERLRARLPVWTQEAHDRLLAGHLDRLASRPQAPAEAVEAVQARLDHLERPGHSLTGPGRSL
jgi:hypothetical protein